MPVVAPPYSYGISASQWVEETRAYLFAGFVEEQNSLVDTVTATQTIIGLTGQMGGIRPQRLVEIDLEMLYVQAVDPVGMTMTVYRGQYGTQPATHLGNAEVTVNPRFPRSRIFNALNAVLVGELSSPGYYAMKAVDLTYAPPQTAYDLEDSGVQEVYQVTFPQYTSQTKRPLEVFNWELEQLSDPVVFPSGQALVFYEQPGYVTGAPIRVRYKASFSPLALLTDDVSVTRIPRSGVDLPPMGAALRLMLGREIKRNFTEGQGESRRPTEVPPGAVAGSAKDLMMKYQQRQQDEAASLAQLYPARTTVYGRLRSFTGWTRC